MNTVIEAPKKGFRAVAVDLIIPFDDCVRILDDSELDNEYERVVRINMELPDAFFDPVSVKIETPDELIQSIVGKMDQVEIPIPVKVSDDPEQVTNMLVKHNLLDDVVKQKDGVFLGVLRKVVTYLEDKKNES